MTFEHYNIATIVIVEMTIVNGSVTYGMEFTALAPTRTRKQQIAANGKTTWTTEEDNLLRSLVSHTHPNSWSTLAQYFPTKTPPQISGRWEKVLNPRLVKGSWTREEDDVILNFVLQNGVKDWAKLALLLNGRTGKQCRERFKNHLDPGLLHKPWTDDEDKQLIDLHKQYGNQWTRIASLMDGRTDNCIKNRWNSTLKKRIERMQNGAPLIQKRGRKRSEYYGIQKIVIPAPEVELNRTTPCSSPLLRSSVIEIVPLGIDQISMLLATRKAGQPPEVMSLAQNRLAFQRMLSDRH
jgi:hypothetical protein